jgi:membrane protein YdbS with pleckstrin-like domain
MFVNAEIAPQDLPAADAVEWRALAPRLRTRLQVGALFNVGVLAAGLLVLALVRPGPFAVLPLWPGWIALALLAAGGFAWPAISVPRKAWAIREHDMLYRSGVLWRTVTAVPFNRIQHVESESTPLDRSFRLATLKLYTAGTASGDLKIHGLPTDVAEDVRVFVLERAGSAVERD